MALSAEDKYRFALRVIGFACTTFYVFIYGLQPRVQAMHPNPPCCLHETATRYPYAIAATACSTPSPRPAGDRYFFDGKAGYAWSPAHYDEQGNTTLEFEGMVIWSYFGLGVQLMRASFDENLDRAAYLTDACVYGLFSLHGVSMLFSALADYDREYGHVMPYGDVPLLFMLSAVLFVTKRGYDAAKQA